MSSRQASENNQHSGRSDKCARQVCPKFIYRWGVGMAQKKALTVAKWPGDAAQEHSRHHHHCLPWRSGLQELLLPEALADLLTAATSPAG